MTTHVLTLSQDNVLDNNAMGIKSNTGPLADSHEIKGFYKGYFRQNKGYLIEILTKVKSKSMSNFRVILSDPDL